MRSQWARKNADLPTSAGKHKSLKIKLPDVDATLFLFIQPDAANLTFLTCHRLMSENRTD